MSDSKWPQNPLQLIRDYGITDERNIRERVTPSAVIRAAKRSMGGYIDLDPASSEMANRIVAAEHYCTIEDNGLEQPWKGRVWLAPPPLPAKIVLQFAERLVEQYQLGSVTAAIVMIDNLTENKPFQLLFQHAVAMCCIDGDFSFYMTNGVELNAIYAQVALYFGKSPKQFVCGFRELGQCLILKESSSG